MALIALILMSVTVVVLDSVPELDGLFGAGFWYAEVFFTALFTLEYATRTWCTHNRPAYLFSFWGIIDLLAIVPTYIAFLYPDAAPLVVIRLLRVCGYFACFAWCHCSLNSTRSWAFFAVRPVPFLYFWSW